VYDGLFLLWLAALLWRLILLFVCFEDGLEVCFVEGDFEVFEYVGSSDESWDFV